MAINPTLIAINIGNSRTQIGLFDEGKLDREQHFANDDQANCVKQIVTWWKSAANSGCNSIFPTFARICFAPGKGTRIASLARGRCYFLRR